MPAVPQCNPNGNCFTRTILRHGICEKCRSYCSHSVIECHCDGFIEECLQPSTTTQQITPKDPSIDYPLITGLVVGLLVFAIAAAILLYCYRRQIRRTAHQLYRKCRPQRDEGPDEEPDENIALIDSPASIKSIVSINIPGRSNFGEKVTVTFILSESGQCDGYRLDLHTGENFNVVCGNPIQVSPHDNQVVNYTQEITGLSHGQHYEVTVIPLLQGRDGSALKKAFYTKPHPATNLRQTNTTTETCLHVQFTWPAGFCNNCVVCCSNETEKEVSRDDSHQPIEIAGLTPGTSYTVSVKSQIQESDSCLETMSAKALFRTLNVAAQVVELTDDSDDLVE